MHGSQAALNRHKRHRAAADYAALASLMRVAVEAFNALPEDKQRALREAQRRSWVIGEMMLDHPDMTRDEAERLYREALRNG